MSKIEIQGLMSKTEIQGLMNNTQYWLLPRSSSLPFLIACPIAFGLA